MLKLILLSVLTFAIGKIICAAFNTDDLSGNIMYVMGGIYGVFAGVIIDKSKDKQ